LAVAGTSRSPGRSPTAILQPSVAQHDDAQLAAAFRELHGSRLHGFAILVALGDRQLAERAAGFSLAAGARQAAALRHPERAAAWLRARTLRALHGPRPFRRSPTAEDRRAALIPLGVDDAVYRGLAALSLDARAAFVASAVERFDPIDVETIIDAAPAATRHNLAEARRRYLRAAAEDDSDAEVAAVADEPTGELATRVGNIARRAFSTSDQRR
jgi:hypothetical protein